MIRKNKKTHLVAKPAPATGEQLLVARDARDWFREMDRWFDDLRTEFEHGLWDPSGALGRGARPGIRLPAINLSDNGHEYRLTAELPGVSKEDVDIRVTPDGVELTAETEKENEETEKGHMYRERVVQSFRRSLRLPESIVAEKADAKLKDGILELRLPKGAPSLNNPPVPVRVE
jgi:HSP20 family protein